MVNVFSFDPPLHQTIWKLLAVIFGKYFVIFLDKCSKVLLNSTTAKKSVSTFSFFVQGVQKYAKFEKSSIRISCYVSQGRPKVAFKFSGLFI